MWKALVKVWKWVNKSPLARDLAVALATSAVERIATEKEDRTGKR